MTDQRADLFTAIRPFAPGRSFSNKAWIDKIDSLADDFGLPRIAEPPKLASAPATKKPVTLAAIVGTAAAAILTPLVMTWESGGKDHLLPYRDIVGVWTQCHGETKGVTAASPKETPEGCAIKLDSRLAGFAANVQTCTPSLKGRDKEWAAATSLAYNIGVTAYCGSTVDRRFDAGDRKGACDAFLMWNKAGGKVVAGLDRRRRAERDLCLQGAAV